MFDRAVREEVMSDISVRTFIAELMSDIPVRTSVLVGISACLLPSPSNLSARWVMCASSTPPIRTLRGGCSSWRDSVGAPESGRLQQWEDELEEPVV